ncbi:hypothetical protein Tco_0032953 [Tanacetum coccineum]
MADLTFADSHNMVAYLEKSEDNVDFVEIVNFLNASPIRYALTISPTIYVSYIEQFWSTAKIKTVNNETQIRAKVNGKTIVITESSMRRDLHFNDVDGTMTPLFVTMLIQSQAVEGEGSGPPTESQHTPATALPSHVEPIPIVASSSQPKKTQKHRKTKRKSIKISQSSRPTTLVADETVHEERGDSVERAATTATSLDAEQGSVLDLENVKNAQALEIQKLKKRVKKLESKKKSRTPQLMRRLFKERNEIDQDEGISWFQEDSETQGRYGHDIGVNTASTSITTAIINITTVEPVTIASVPITTVGVSISTAEPSTPPTITTIVIEDKDLTIAQTLMKMRSKLDKEAKLEREREEEASKDANIAEWDDVQAMMDVDYELAAKLQAEEQGEISIEERERSELAEELRDKEADELSQEELQQMMIIVTEQGMNVEALKTKYPIIDWKIYTEGTRKYPSRLPSKLIPQHLRLKHAKSSRKLLSEFIDFKQSLYEEAGLKRKKEEASKATNNTEWDEVQAMMVADYIAAKLTSKRVKER